MAQILNEYCESCVKASVCEWSTKLYKLEGTEKKLGVLNITVNGCDQYLSFNNDEFEENPKEDE
jgi:hypothetical protein